MPVKQIVTGTVCHLEADMVKTALEGWEPANLDMLFIENVGNLVCPATFDLGEDLRLVLFSVTEGEDKPLKYPTIFNTADLAVVTKMDIADAVGFDRDDRPSKHPIRPARHAYSRSVESNRKRNGSVARLPRSPPGRAIVPSLKSGPGG